MIHENICESRKVNAVNLYAEVLWIRLITKADDNGNFYADPRRVHPACMIDKPATTESLTAKAMKALIDVGLLQQYEADERPWVHVTNFHEFQDLPGDRYALVKFPLHPAEMGGAYVGDGLRRQVWVEKEERIKRELSAEESRSTRGEVGEFSRSVQGKIPPEVEVEVEKEGEVEVSGGGQSFEEETYSDGNFGTFKKLFKSVAGVRVKDFKSRVEQYTDLCRKYGESAVLDAINAWVAQEGGKASTRKDNWAVKNFLDAVPDLIEEQKQPAPEPERAFPKAEVHPL